MTESPKRRLATMMFFQYFIPGATLPVFSLYLKDNLHFQAYQVGLIMAMPSIAAMISLPLATRFSDRYISAERTLALCHCLAAILMGLLFGLSSFLAVLACYFLYGIFFSPTFGLTNTVALHHARDPQRDFGGIRMWGTIGWCTVAWVFGYGWLHGAHSPGGRLSHGLLLSALCSLIFALYALTFRPAKYDPQTWKSIPYREVFKVFRRPSLLVLCAMTVLNNACHQCYYFGMGPYLHQQGFHDGFIMPAMSLGQFVEIVLLGLLSWFLLRLGAKRALLVGVLCQTLRFLIFAWQGSTLLILFGISLHGICYAFYFTTAYLYVDQHSTPETRAGAQQVLTFAIAGFGTFMGYILAGVAAHFFTLAGSSAIDFERFWLVPALLSAVIALVLVFFFREEPPVKNKK